MVSPKGQVCRDLADNVRSPKSILLTAKERILIGSDGNIPHKEVMRSIALLGHEVIPALHEVTLHPYA